MAYSLEFERLVEYDTRRTGITVEIRLKIAGSEVAVSPKIDTGSTDCVFVRAVGEDLGLEIEKGESGFIGTATGNFRAFLHPVTLSILDYDFDIYAYFAEDENFNRNVLGRLGFLDRVNIGLIDYEGKLFLSEYTGE